jgi:hypothetical protein
VSAGAVGPFIASLNNRRTNAEVGICSDAARRSTVAASSPLACDVRCGTCDETERGGNVRPAALDVVECLSHEDVNYVSGLLGPHVRLRNVLD